MIFKNAEEVRLFDFSSTSDVHKLYILGWSILGIGNANYIRVGSSTNISSFDGPDIISADGSLWKLSTNHIRPENFGAIPKTHGNGSTLEWTKNTRSINEFFIHITQNDVGTAYITGEFEVDGELFLGKDNSGTVVPLVLTKHLIGSPVFILKGSSRLNTLFTIHGFKFSMWDGRITIKGPNRIWKERQIIHGVIISGCTRSVFGGFICEYLAGYGVYCSSEHFDSGNSTMVSLGDCRFSFCGSGSNRNNDSDFMITSYSNPREILDYRFSQLDVGEIPGIDILPNIKQRPLILLNKSSYHIIPQQNRIGNQETINKNNNTIIITPSINSSGNLKWIFGGGIWLQGADVGIININSIDAVNSAISLNIGAEYGPTVNRIVNHNCFSAVNPVRRTANQVSTTNINAIYCENNYCYWSGTGGSYSNINGLYSFDFIKDIPQIDSFPNSLYGMTINRNGTLLSYEKKGRNKSESHSRVDLLIDNKSIVKTYKKDNISIQLAIDDAANAVFGYDSAQITIMGNGINSSPTGNITFTTKDNNHTINGSTNLILSNFCGPAIISIYFEFNSLNFIVAATNKR